uniref:Taste receptor type 2 n=1 Tax=Calidris pygmaea TaxID=425635 RepID=A0A8C3J834_9CHAR
YGWLSHIPREKHRQILCMLNTADKTSKMLPPVLIISIGIVALEVVVGVAGNGFITAVNIINCIKTKKISSADIILIFLSTSRFILQMTILMHIHSLYFADEFKLAAVYKAFGAVWMFVNHASLWLSTWLYVLYCVKIILPMAIAANQDQNRWDGPVAHCTLLSVVTSALLITSLWKHTKKIQYYVETFRDPLIDVHLTAIKSIISFLILYLSSFVAQILLILSTSQSKDVVKVAVSLVAAGVYPSIHSIILIIVNSKLKLAFRILCQHFKCPLANTALCLIL